MTRSIHSFEDDAESILNSMGLRREILSEVCQRGLAQYLTATVHHPQNAAGSFFYHEAVRSLRDLLISSGWEHVSDGLELTFNSDRKIAIAVSSGNVNVGDRLRRPAFKYPKGPRTGAAVAGNTKQLNLFEGFANLQAYILPIPPQRVGFERFQTWWLLHYVDPISGKMKAELSLPIAIAGLDETNQFEYRIILDSINPSDDLNITHEGDGDDNPDLDVDVRKKG
jgi:hypothetical protein